MRLDSGCQVCCGSACARNVGYSLGYDDSGVSEGESDYQIRCCCPDDRVVSGSCLGGGTLPGPEIGFAPLQCAMSNDESARLVRVADHGIPNRRPFLLSGVHDSAFAERLGLDEPESGTGSSPSA